ncbi:hypothetical protein D3C85_1522390 [compost metagenome]
MGQHQLAHVLPRHADHLGHVGQPDQIGGHLDQLGRRYGATHIGQCTANSRICVLSLAGELQRQPPRLADAYQGIVAASLAKALDQYIRVTVIIGELVFQSEGVFHRATPLRRRRPPAAYGAWCSYPRRAAGRVRGCQGSSACSIRW